MEDIKSKHVRDVVKQVIDKETGQVLDETVEKHFSTSVKTDSFFMVFFENFGTFLGLKNGSDIKLMACMCTKADFNTGLVRMSTSMRREICSEAGISLTNINKNLKRLSDVGLLILKEGDYVINPTVFWKGTMKSRTELLREGGMTFKVRLVGAE